MSRLAGIGKTGMVVAVATIVIVTSVGISILGNSTSRRTLTTATNLTTITRYCSDYYWECGITSATWSSGSTTTVILIEFVNSSTTEFFTETISHSSPSWQVLKTNVTVSYDTGCMVLEAVGHTCPPKGANTTTSSLTGVKLILYRGTDYYAGNFSAGPYGQTAVSYLTVWFTNTTIYCFTPPKDNYPACS